MKTEEREERETEKRVAALAQLRARYVEAQGLAMPGQPHENLDWILGGRRDLNQDPLRIHSNRIELIGLWLEDLAAELESWTSGPDAAGAEGIASQPERSAAASKLRDAARVFFEPTRPALEETNPAGFAAGAEIRAVGSPDE